MLALSDSYSSNCFVMEVDNDDFDWFSDTFDRFVTVSTRKRKAEKDISFDDSCSDFDDSWVSDVKVSRLGSHQCVADRSRASTKVGCNRLILKMIMSYLPEDDLRRAAMVTKSWRQKAVFRLHQLSGNKPFLLLWRTGKVDLDLEHFTMDAFVDPIANGPHKLQAVLFTATDSFEELGPEFRSARFLPETNCSVAFSDKLIVTSTDKHSFTREIDYPEGYHAIQALCIPISSSFVIKTYNVPVWGTDDDGNIIDFDKISASFAETVHSPTGLTLKGMTLLQYQDEPLVKNLMTQRLNLENQTIPLVGGVVNNLMSNKMSSPRVCTIASGWAIFGDQSVSVASVALEVDGPLENDIFVKISQHFGARSGFILMLYKSNLDYRLVTEEIRKNVTKIPIVGLQTLGDMDFQGDAILRHSPTSIRFPNPADSMDIYKVTCLLVAY